MNYFFLTYMHESHSTATATKKLDARMRKENA